MLRIEKGDTGTSVSSAEVDENGDLIISLSDGTDANAGHVVGAQGEQGIVGPQGPRGDGLSPLDRYDTYDELKAAHPTGEPGQTYFVGNEVYVWSETAQDWESVGELQGAPGETGPHYIPAVDENGNLSWTNNGGLENPAPRNITGPAGADGADGTDGADGAPGAPGQDGAPGADGKSAYAGAQEAGYEDSEEKFYTDLALLPKKINYDDDGSLLTVMVDEDAVDIPPPDQPPVLGEIDVENALVTLEDQPTPEPTEPPLDATAGTRTGILRTWLAWARYQILALIAKVSAALARANEAYDNATAAGVDAIDAANATYALETRVYDDRSEDTTRWNLVGELRRDILDIKAGAAGAYTTVWTDTTSAIKSESGYTIPAPEGFIQVGGSTENGIPATLLIGNNEVWSTRGVQGTLIDYIHVTQGDVVKANESVQFADYYEYRYL